MSGVDSGGEHQDGSFWCRRFRFGALRVAVEEEFGAGLGGTVWGGAVALARHLSDEGGAAAAADELGADAAPLTALELGAGCCGLPSLAAAHSGRFARVIVTDWYAPRCALPCERHLTPLRGLLRTAATYSHGYATTWPPTPQLPLQTAVWR